MSKIILTTSIFDRPFTIKGLIIPSLSLFIVTFLTYVVYVQNLQIIELVNLIKKLQGQIDLINTNFKLLEDQKNTEIQALQESVKVLMKTSSSIDSESIRAETERRALYIKHFSYNSRFVYSFIRWLCSCL
jgi:predicted PurR-regulated permease PerM